MISETLHKCRREPISSGLVCYSDITMATAYQPRGRGKPVRYLTTLPPDLHRKLMDAARRSKTSANRLLIAILDEWFDEADVSAMRDVRQCPRCGRFQAHAPAGSKCVCGRRWPEVAT